MSTTLVTGAAGFIGMHVCHKLISNGENVFGIDNLNPYYDVKLKEKRLEYLTHNSRFKFKRIDITDLSAMQEYVKNNNVQKIIHLAAQAGVRYSITNPHDYGNSNLIGFLNILEICRNFQIEHLVYASSSSVYGTNQKVPFCETDAVDHPISLYAATKRANELMAHTYSHLYNIPTTGLRLFTVYGPWGRPDMSPILFARAIFEQKPISIFNYGKMKRDFTYIDDVVDGMIAVLHKPPPLCVDKSKKTTKKNKTYEVPWKIFNIGNHTPVGLCDYIDIMESIIGRKAIRQYKEMQPGDVPETFADTQKIKQWTIFEPHIPLKTGLPHLIKWVKEYYQY